jgi:hypothetical protein
MNVFGGYDLSASSAPSLHWTYTTVIWGTSDRSNATTNMNIHDVLGEVMSITASKTNMYQP